MSNVSNLSTLPMYAGTSTLGICIMSNAQMAEHCAKMVAELSVEVAGYVARGDMVRLEVAASELSSAARKLARAQARLGERGNLRHVVEIDEAGNIVVLQNDVKVPIEAR